MESKRVAVLLSGIHYIEGDEERRVDFRQYYRNIKHYIYNKFSSQGFELDTFISTNRSKISNELLQMYSPIRYSFLSNTPRRRVDKTIEALKLLVDYVRETKNTYDIVCVTRFDIYFLEEIANVHFKKLNIMSKVLTRFDVDENLIDDNIYIFPGFMLEDFFNIFSNFYKCIRIPAAIAHWMLPAFEEKFPLHYIKNERTTVPGLTSFKLRLFDSVDLLLNKYMFTENVKYRSKTNSAQIEIYNETHVHFSKIREEACIYSWFGYELDVGKYKITFEILSDTNIDKYIFLKSHMPDTYYTIEPIIKDKPMDINIEISIKQMKTPFIFIFDSYKGFIDIHFKNIQIVKVV